MNAYLSDELASGSEAEQSALRKRSQRQQKVKPSKKGYSQLQSSTATTPFACQHSSSSRPISRTLGAFSKPRPSDICFACGQQVIGGLCVKLILKPDLQAPGRPPLVLLASRALEVNRTTELKTCSPRLDISFTQFIRHVSFLLGVFQGKGL